MLGMKRIFWSCMCLATTLMPSCRMVWAAEAEAEWASPRVQEVRMPAGIQAGVYYPEHDELVIVKPGAWVKEQAPDSAKDTLVPEPQKQKEVEAVITLSGRLKLAEGLKLIAQAMEKGLVVGEGVENVDVAFELKDLPATRALSTVLYPLGYGYKVRDGDLLVLAKDTRQFRLNLPPVTQAFTTATTNESTSAAESSGNDDAAQGRVRVGAKVLVENSSGLVSYWHDMEANVKNLVTPQGIVSVNKAAGVVVVTDTPRALDAIDVFFKEMNARAAEQITVDVKVVEVELSNEHKLGIDWNAIASAGSLRGLSFTTNFAGQNIASGNMMTFTGRADKDGSGDIESGVKAVLKALESYGRIEVVSQPRLMMLNNSVASIQVGETRSYVESTQVEATQSGGTITSATLNEVHGGVTLQIVGSIVGDDVFLNVTPVVSTIDDIRTITLGGGSKLEAPDTSIKTMSTLVRVKAGHTVAVGGLIARERGTERYGVPFLSKIPLLGKAFSFESRKNNRTELVIFMTPRRG